MTFDTVRVGIGIITFNRLPHVLNTVEKVIQHTKCEYQLLIADDGSSDGTADALKSRGYSVITGPNRGVCWNKNRALFHLHAVAKCDVVILLEDDTFPSEDGWENVWIEAGLRFGHIGLAGSWFKERFTAGTGVVNDPFQSPVISGQCVSYSAECLSYIGYFDTRFRGYGVGHAEHTMRCARVGYGGTVQIIDGAKQFNFYLIDSNLTVTDPGGNRNDIQIARNHEVLTAIEHEPVYRSCWRTDDEMQDMRTEQRLVSPKVGTRGGVLPPGETRDGFDRAVLQRYPDIAESAWQGVFVAIRHYQARTTDGRKAEKVIQLDGAIKPAMTPVEQRFFIEYLRQSKNYLEFGSGGSTVLAAAYVAESVTSLDSSEPWQAEVRQSCIDAGTRLVPFMVHVDIGPVRDWGHPADETFKARWPSYIAAVWHHERARQADLCMIDGRFRVASFLSALLHCGPSTILLFHDFPERTPYHIVREFADEIAAVDSFVAFRRKPDFDADRAWSVLHERKFDPA